MAKYIYIFYFDSIKLDLVESFDNSKSSDD